MDQFVQKRAWMEALIERRRNTKARAASWVLAGALAFALSPSWSITALLFGWMAVMAIFEVVDFLVIRDALRNSSDRFAQKRMITAALIAAQTLTTASLVAIFWSAIGDGAQIIGLLLILGAMVQVVSNLSSDRFLFYAAFTPYAAVLSVLCVSAVTKVYLVDNWRMVAATVITVGFILGCYVRAFQSRNAQCISAIAGRIRLRQERASAEQAHQAKAQFLAVMSHELRTPMNAMIGSAELLRRTNLSLEQRQQLETLLDGGQMLLALLNDILDMSKIEAGKLQVEAIPTDLGGLLEGLARMWHARAQDKDLDLIVEVAEDVPAGISSDPTRLRQILFNLISNAVKFTNEGEVRVVVSRGERSDGQSLLSIKVIDTGCGMSEDTLERLFKPFQQADASTARKFGGTGLGLSISSGLATPMDGKLSATSKEGEGSSFCLSLPLVEAAVPQAEESDKIDVAATQGLSVLIAEDHPANRRVIGALLQPFGFELIMATNGLEAVEIFEDIGEFDIVLMDLQMPGMDGFEACRNIREMSDEGRDVPIIALTANASREDRAAAAKAGMDDFVPKPIDPRQLHAAMLNAVGRRIKAQVDSQKVLAEAGQDAA